MQGKGNLLVKDWAGQLTFAQLHLEGSYRTASSLSFCMINLSPARLVSPTAMTPLVGPRE